MNLTAGLLLQSLPLPCLMRVLEVEFVAHMTKSRLTLVIDAPLAVVVYFCSLFVNLRTNNEEEGNNSDVITQCA